MIPRRDEIEAKKRLPGIFVLCAFGAVLISILIFLLRSSSQPEQRILPEGWTIIRPPHEVSALTIRSDQVWAGGRDGLFLIDRRSGENLVLPGETPRFSYIKDLLIARDGRVWIAHREGLTSYSNGVWTEHTQTEGLPRAPLTALLEDKTGTLWIGSEVGLTRWNQARFERVKGKEIDKLASVDEICQDSSGVLWFGSSSPTRGGLCRLDGSRWTYLSITDGLIHNTVNDIREDDTGAVWFATGYANRGGASRWHKGVWSRLTRQDGLPGNRVTSVYQDKEGRLWFGSEFDGCAVFDGQTRLIITPEHGLSGWDVKTMFQDPEGVYWLGTEKGLSRIESFSSILRGLNHRPYQDRLKPENPRPEGESRQ